VDLIIIIIITVLGDITVVGLLGLYIQRESKKSPLGFVAIFPKRLGIFRPNFTCLLRVPTKARLRIFMN